PSTTTPSTSCGTRPGRSRSCSSPGSSTWAATSTCPPRASSGRCRRSSAPSPDPLPRANCHGFPSPSDDFSLQFAWNFSSPGTSARLGSGLGLLALGPPGVEAAVGLLLAERALLQAQLEEHRQRRAHVGAGADAQVLHDLLAIDVGPDRIQLLAGLELGDPLLEGVHPLRQLTSLALVAGGAVAPGEL